MKKLLALTLVLSFTFFSAKETFAQTNTSVDKAVQGVREKVGDLATSKDEGDGQTLDLRVEAFKKVLDLSTAEAKDLKLKVLAVEIKDDELLEAWKKAMVTSLNEALAFYEKESGALIEKEIDSIDKIKAVAEDFREWRDANYLPVVSQVNDFMLIQQEEKAVATAEKRTKKIGEDLRKLSKIKNAGKLLELSKNAEILVGEASDLNKKAIAAFRAKYLVVYKKLSKDEALEISSEAIEGESSSSVKALKEISMSQLVESTSSATSSVPSESAGGEAAPEPSIRDLVRSSLTKVKDAYQVFIEMSNFVRKSLN